MIYPTLFLGLPVLGVAAYIVLCMRMADATPSPPYAPLFFVFAGYGALLLFAVSIACGEWSGMHWVAAVGVIFVGTPWLVIQSALLRPARSSSRYHYFVVLSGFWFPAALAVLVASVILLAALRSPAA